MLQGPNDMVRCRGRHAEQAYNLFPGYLAPFLFCEREYYPALLR
jgi:hypothetical protein